MCLFRVGQLEMKKLGWTLKSSMLALMQRKLWKHPCEDVKLTVVDCLSRIIALTSPLMPYNNDIMRDILQLIVEALQGLNNIMLHILQKQHRILELVVEIRFGTFTLNLECDDLIFQVFQNFYTNIASTHLDSVKTNMQKIVSLFLKGDVDIYKILRSKMLTIWRKELIC